QVAQRAAHTINGTLRIFCVSDVQQLAAKIEELGKANRLADAAAVLPKLRLVLSDVIKALRRY
ncbi:MAG: Hpt domain-containing protein, partial [Myxococcales bacterium]|nr:Hpt domain-containing protein [Myxococcales bacterium]